MITPSDFELSVFPDQLAACLDSTEIACVRLTMATKDESRISRAADALRDVTHQRDVALVIDTHFMMVERLGLDGVHLTDAARSVKKVRKELGEDSIIGSFCNASSHDGMTAGELGVDYVSFGPAGKTQLGSGETAPKDLFQWWSQMIETPVVAEGALSESIIQDLAPFTEFFAIGDEIWTSDSPNDTLLKLNAAMQG